MYFFSFYKRLIVEENSLVRDIIILRDKTDIKNFFVGLLVRI